MQDHSSCCRWSVMQAYKYLINKYEGGKEGGWKEGGKKKQPQIFAFSFMQQVSPGFTVERIRHTEKKGGNFLKVWEFFNLFSRVSVVFSNHLSPENDFEEFKYFPSCLIIQVSSIQQFLKITPSHQKPSKWKSKPYTSNRVLL